MIPKKSEYSLYLYIVTQATLYKACSWLPNNRVPYSLPFFSSLLMFIVLLLNPSSPLHTSQSCSCPLNTSIYSILTFSVLLIRTGLANQLDLYKNVCRQGNKRLPFTVALLFFIFFSRSTRRINKILIITKTKRLC